MKRPLSMRRYGVIDIIYKVLKQRSFCRMYLPLRTTGSVLYLFGGDMSMFVLKNTLRARQSPAFDVREASRNRYLLLFQIVGGGVSEEKNILICLAVSSGFCTILHRNGPRSSIVHKTTVVPRCALNCCSLTFKEVLLVVARGQPWAGFYMYSNIDKQWLQTLLTCRRKFGRNLQRDSTNAEVAL